MEKIETLEELFTAMDCIVDVVLKEFSTDCKEFDDVKKRMRQLNDELKNEDHKKPEPKNIFGPSIKTPAVLRTKEETIQFNKFVDCGLEKAAQKVKDKEKTALVTAMTASDGAHIVNRGGKPYVMYMHVDFVPLDEYETKYAKK